MPVASENDPVNLLLEGLPTKERNQLLKYGEPVSLVRGDILFEPHQNLRYVYFPLSGFVSLSTLLHGHPPLSVDLVGNEGMLGAVLALGVPAATTRALVCNAGRAWRFQASCFQSELLGSRSLLRAVHGYLFEQIARLTRNVACTHFHEIEPRLARWLLMAHDRAHTDQFHLTHESLASMLGAHRSGITIAAGVLARRNLIAYTRGKIHILDRPGLEQIACECYAASLTDRVSLPSPWVSAREA